MDSKRIERRADRVDVLIRQLRAAAPNLHELVIREIAVKMMGEALGDRRRNTLSTVKRERQ